ncbi:thiol peroxidase [Aureibacillus halotolerans]|uniref:Thiol peroxidase n=1 Tax=Aureibacillus halotolerans TaxID=1508390 RepID=A0A4R6U0C3_9BACI|nr:thiol peroxidase [Aureibacillus halotolerans]TDQ39106.1 thiol peroxidase (atypical 2-Cys peroxiredoxin) [Aureibacillus halotolerans]
MGRAGVTFKDNAVTLAGNEVKPGDKAPDFKVLTTGLEERTLSDYKGTPLIISVVPSLDTGVCDAQTRKFNEAADTIPNVKVLTISVDLPFAQKRWCGANGIDSVETLSDHKDLSFGTAYGVHIEELRLLARSVFVIDANGTITYAEYVPEVTNHPDYEAALSAARSIQ